jgi:hypothetical protein
MGAETKGIGQLIEERKSFRVPDHQRDFSWPVGAVEQYLDDVSLALQTPAPHYFIGLVVLVDPDSEGTWRILDGQQRIATTTMVYAAMRHWLRENGFSADADLLQQSYIGVAELGQAQHRARLTLNVNNSGVFEEVVVNQASDEQLEKRKRDFGRNSSNRRLIEAMMACRNAIRELARSGGPDLKAQAAKLYKMAEYIRDNVQLVCMDVSSTDNAYVIFEALNDRGVDLSVLDLVKNHVFSKAGTRLAQAQSDWIRMVASLGDRKADDFLKAFWTSRYGRIQKGSLFREISHKYSTNPQAMNLSQELKADVDLYAAYDLSDSEVWSEHSEKAREHVRTLSLLGGTQPQPIVMSALRKFDREQMEKLLHYLICLIIRYQLIGGGRTGRLELTIAKIAPSIATGALKTPAAIWRELVPIIPSDEEFMQDFQVFTETKMARARYILAELEMSRRKANRTNRKSELAPVSAGTLTVEHILPKNPSQEWKSVISSDSSIVADCVNRLGNLCLVDESANRSLGSKAFKKKSEQLYQQSELLLTQDVAQDRDVWGRAQIDKRQRELAQLAVKTWPQ